MNRKIALAIIIASVSVCHAQYESQASKPDYSVENNKMRPKYRNLSFVHTEMKQDGPPNLKSNYGTSFTVGRTFFLHKRPIAGLLQIGIDATWFDLCYTNYKIKHIMYIEEDNYENHQGELSMHIGPSLTINPVRKLNIHGYFRFAPSFSVLYTDDTFYGNYAPFFITGLSVSYNVIGLGIESRTGKCTYKKLGSFQDDKCPPNNKIKNKGWRAYLTFRF